MFPLASRFALQVEESNGHAEKSQILPSAKFSLHVVLPSKDFHALKDLLEYHVVFVMEEGCFS